MRNDRPLPGISFALVLLAGCSGGAGRFEAPDVDADSAAEAAIALYDANGDGALDEQELAKCPGILSKLAAYDSDGNKKVDQGEISRRLGALFQHGIGGTQLNCGLVYKGKPLAGASIVMEPEPYLGEEVQTASGTTDGSGYAALSIPPEFTPEHLRRLKTVHYGTFKVRVTHPSIKLPANVNTETILGYETEPGNPLAQFNLDKPGEAIVTAPVPTR